MKTSNSSFFFRNAAASQAAKVSFLGSNPSAVAATVAAAVIPGPGAWKTAGQCGRRAVASALMFVLVPLSMGDLYAQQGPPPPPADYGQQGPAYQSLPPEELNRLVAPIALYPDSLVAQVLAASTYPAQVASASQFLQQYGGAPPEQIADMANQQPWDPSVKALTAFPQVLSNLNQNIQWTTALGNAYYNQPQDVMGAVQAMRQQAYAAGNLRAGEQLNVVYQPGAIVIEPINPGVVYVPYYNPWVVYGAPIAPWGYYHYYGPPRGVGFGVGLALGFGVGIAIGAFTHFGWGYHNWAPNWGSRTVVFNHNTYISNSVTVVNHGNYGGFDRNPQARAFNHTQAAQFANVNHTTINNVSINRTNVNNENRTNVNNFNRAGGNNGNYRGSAAPSGGYASGSYARGTQTGQYNNAGRPGQFSGQSGQLGNNGGRPAQAYARPAQPTGQSYQSGQSGQVNGAARSTQAYARPSQAGGQGGQFNGGSRPSYAAPSNNRGGAPQGGQQHSQPQAHASHGDSHDDHHR